MDTTRDFSDSRTPLKLGEMIYLCERSPSRTSTCVDTSYALCVGGMYEAL